MMVKTFQSEISKQDLDDQIREFLLEGDYTVIEIESRPFPQQGWTDYIARLTYEEKFSLVDIVEQIEGNLLYRHNQN